MKRVYRISQAYVGFFPRHKPGLFGKLALWNRPLIADRDLSTAPSRDACTYNAAVQHHSWVDHLNMASEVSRRHTNRIPMYQKIHSIPLTSFYLTFGLSVRSVYREELECWQGFPTY